MDIQEGLKHVESVADAELEVSGRRVAVAYTQSFERVAAQGDDADVARLADRLGRSVRTGTHPHPAEATAVAESILDTDDTDAPYTGLTD